MSDHSDATPSTNVPSLLDAQIDCARQLQDILDAETQALLAADLNALAELVQRKQQAAETLEQLSRSLSAATGGAPAERIPNLGEQASSRWQTLRETAELLRKVNLHNGALLSERQARLRWIAEQAGLEPAPALYGPGTPAARPAGLGRHLAQA